MRSSTENGLSTVRIPFTVVVSCVCVYMHTYILKKTYSFNYCKNKNNKKIIIIIIIICLLCLFLLLVITIMNN